MQLFTGMIIALGLTVAMPVAPAVAQGQPAIAVGMQVTDASGGSVGTVKAIQGDNLLIKTDKHEVLLPKSSFSANAGKLLFGMTQAQLNAEVEKSLAAASASVAVGATVKGVGGTPVGTIEAVEADGTIVALTGGKKVKLPANALRGNADGTVTIGYTAAQLEEIVAKATSQQPPAQ